MLGFKLKSLGIAMFTLVTYDVIASSEIFMSSSEDDF